MNYQVALVGELLFLCALGGFLLHLLLLWGQMQVDQFRLSVFALRDRLFDVFRGRADFDNPCHRLLRDLLNSAIRYAEKSSLASIFLSKLILPRNHFAISEPYIRAINESIESLDEPDRKRVKEIHREFGFLMLKHLLLVSPISTMFLVFWIVVVIGRLGVQGIAEKLRQKYVQILTVMTMNPTKEGAVSHQS